MIPQIFKCGLCKWEEKLLTPKAFGHRISLSCQPHASLWSCGFGGKASDNHLTSFITLIKRAGENSLHTIIRIWVSTGQSNTSRKGGRKHAVGAKAFEESSARRWSGERMILPVCLGKLWPAPSLFAFLLGKFNFTSLIYSVIVKWSWWKDDLNLIFNLLVWTDKRLSCNMLFYRMVTFSPGFSESQSGPLQNRNDPCPKVYIVSWKQGIRFPPSGWADPYSASNPTETNGTTRGVERCTGMV